MPKKTELTVPSLARWNPVVSKDFKTTICVFCSVDGGIDVFPIYRSHHNHPQKTRWMFDVDTGEVIFDHHPVLTPSEKLDLDDAELVAELELCVVQIPSALFGRVRLMAAGATVCLVAKRVPETPKSPVSEPAFQLMLAPA